MIFTSIDFEFAREAIILQTFTVTLYAIRLKYNIVDVLLYTAIITFNCALLTDLAHQCF